MKTQREIIQEAMTLISVNFADPKTIEGRRAIQAVNLLMEALDTAPDRARIDWLEKQARKSPTGISFDYVPYCDGEPSGFRFMRQFHIGEPHMSIRNAIDTEMDA